ncbi:biotin transporter BioY [Orrella sp. NBD-18]|uniref:Biotin transporter n=1 Tax=Sheuella amnicola TaxID=2707330 RepID=A0A6B2R6Z2_9BURK|nr:biotin transporter BioY [Sheuella amnicola]NDY83095.1 biotin transporter BioY [Sheuella amnicola]HBI82198.1 BioY family transporter [Alcaligenaceae bacterium]
MNTKDLVLVALFTALVAVMSLIPPIPMPLIPVPVTLQTFGVMLTGLILGPRKAGVVLSLYVLIALVGLPVLPGGRAGLAVLMGPTGGFLLGMIPGAFLTGLIAGQAPTRIGPADKTGVFWQVARLWLASVSGGVLLVYLLGIPWLAYVAKMDLQKAGLLMLAFIPIDLLKALLAAVIAQRVRRYQGLS